MEHVMEIKIIIIKSNNGIFAIPKKLMWIGKAQILHFSNQAVCDALMIDKSGSVMSLLVWENHFTKISSDKFLLELSFFNSKGFTKVNKIEPLEVERENPQNNNIICCPTILNVKR